jgi:hypothetical protein
MNKKILTSVILGSLVLCVGFLGKEALAETQRFSNSGNRLGFNRNMETKAGILNVSIDWLKKEIESGKNFIDILKNKGLDIVWFRDQVKNTKINDINQLLKDNKITEDQAKIMRERIESQKGDCSGPSMQGKGLRQGFGKMMRK